MKDKKCCSDCRVVHVSDDTTRRHDDCSDSNCQCHNNNIGLVCILNALGMLAGLLYAAANCPVEQRWLFVTIFTMWSGSFLFWNHTKRTERRMLHAHHPYCNCGTSFNAKDEGKNDEKVMHT